MSNGDLPVTASPAAVIMVDPSRDNSNVKATDGKRVQGAPRARVTHTVREGETLTAIATRHGVTVDALKKLNKLSSTVLTKGQRLRLPA